MRTSVLWSAGEGRRGREGPRWGVSFILVLRDEERGQVLAEVGGLDGVGLFGSEDEERE